MYNIKKKWNKLKNICCVTLNERSDIKKPKNKYLIKFNN